MGLLLRNNIYWLDFMFEGQRIRESLQTGNKKLAEKRYAKCVTDIVEGRYFEASEAKTKTFDEMVEKYMRKNAHSRDATSIKPLKGFFGGMLLYKITTPLAAEYQDERLDDVKEATVYQELSLLRRMFNVAKKRWKWVKENPVSDGDLQFSIGNRNARDRWLTVEEEQVLLDNATNPIWLRPLLMAALQQACGEANCWLLPGKISTSTRDLAGSRSRRTGRKGPYPCLRRSTTPSKR